jgi:hypothetical protein
MDENLVGYLLNALDPDTQREVGAYLKDNPEVQRRLDLLRQSLEPLAVDREEIAPPAGLVLRTLAGVAEYQCRRLPEAPTLPLTPPVRTARRWWGRADVLVAAGLLLAIAGLAPPVVDHARQKHQIEKCANNLRGFHDALQDYSTRKGSFPNVANEPWPHNVAGMMVPLVQDATGTALNVRCPGNGKPHSPSWTAAEIRAMDHQQFLDDVAGKLLGCYAYSLGYRDDAGRYRALRPTAHGRLPIMADGPPEDRGDGNSPNHRGKGQNVLFADGQVQFLDEPRVYGHDLYRNDNGEVQAGLHPRDIVLGASNDRPNPPPSRAGSP